MSLRELVALALLAPLGAVTMAAAQAPAPAPTQDVAPDLALCRVVRDFMERQAAEALTALKTASDRVKALEAEVARLKGTEKK